MKHQSIAAEHDGAGTDSRDTPRVRHLNLCILRALRPARLADTRVTGRRPFAKPSPDDGRPLDTLWWRAARNGTFRRRLPYEART